VTTTEAAGDTALSTAHLLDHCVSTEAALEEILGTPHPAIMGKHTTFTTPLIRDFIRQARFFVLSTSDANGNCDSSPRGDIESTVLFPDDTTVVIADRPGNRRADSYRNILQNPHVGILFLVPGNDEVVRVNGRATLTTHPEALTQMTIAGKPARLGIVVEVDEVYVHCARAVLRSKMWAADTWLAPEDIPSVRDMAAQQHDLVVAADAEPARSEEYRKHLY
jgi:PPOX class probable FMN-dependent enzyme